MSPPTSHAALAVAPAPTCNPTVKAVRLRNWEIGPRHPGEVSIAALLMLQGALAKLYPAR